MLLCLVQDPAESSGAFCVFESSVASLRVHVSTVEPSKGGDGLQATHQKISCSSVLKLSWTLVYQY